MSCAHNFDAKKSARKQAFSELNNEFTDEGRSIASSAASKKYLAIAPGIENASTFKVMVFPKLTNKSEKTSDSVLPNYVISKMSESQQNDYYQEMIEYGKPTTYTFDTPRSIPCYQLAKQSGKLQASKFFGGYKHFEENKKLKCLILRVKLERLKTAQIKRDDIVAKYIYIDQFYRPYGVLMQIANRKSPRRSGDFRTIALRLDPSKTLTSGLTLFPIDVPNLGVNNSSHRNMRAVNNPTELPRDRYVRKQVRRYSKVDFCSKGAATGYKNEFGDKVFVGWCRGHLWPTIINSTKYLAVLKNTKANK